MIKHFNGEDKKKTKWIEILINEKKTNKLWWTNKNCLAFTDYVNIYLIRNETLGLARMKKSLVDQTERNEQLLVPFNWIYGTFSLCISRTTMVQIYKRNKKSKIIPTKKKTCPKIKSIRQPKSTKIKNESVFFLYFLYVNCNCL